MISEDHKNTPWLESGLRTIVIISGIIAAYVVLRCILYRFFDFFQVNHEYAQDAALVFVIAAYSIGRAVADRKESR